MILMLNPNPMFLKCFYDTTNKFVLNLAHGREFVCDKYAQFSLTFTKLN